MNETYKQTGKGLSGYDVKKLLPHLKKQEETAWLKETYRFFPSSKTCHVCLNRVDSLALDIRYWECPKCKAKHDRDINAAINIRDEGLRILKTGLSLERGIKPVAKL